jgi:hypothetical protein
MNVSSAGSGDGDVHGFMGLWELDENLYGELRGIEFNSLEYPKEATLKKLELVPCP